MAEIQVLLLKNMHDSCLHFIPGVSNPDQGKCIILELYFTFELSADKDAAFTFTFTFNRRNLVIRYINMSSYLLPIDLSGSFSLNPSFTKGDVRCILPSQSMYIQLQDFVIRMARNNTNM